MDESAATARKNQHLTFADVATALAAGKIIVVKFDANPAEDHDANGTIVCGPEAGKGYLGVLIAGEQYEVTYNSVAHSWTTRGPYQAIPTCGIYSETYGPAQLGSIKARPEDGDLILWGAAMSFDAKLDVYDSAKRKVGHVSIK